MIVKDFIQQHCAVLPLLFPIVETIGNGNNGETYLLNDNTVLKVSVLMDWAKKGIDIREEYANIWWILRQLKQDNPSHIVRLFDLGVLSCGQENRQPYTIYYYRMRRLFPLSEDESKVFQTVISHEDRHLIKHYEPNELDVVLKGLEKGLEFQSNKVKWFYQQIQSSKFKHLDLHQRNIMKTQDGDYRLVDLDHMVIRRQ